MNSSGTFSIINDQMGKSEKGFCVLIMLLGHLFCVATAPVITFAATPGDRRPNTRCVYPQDVFLHAGNGGQVIDVTKAPFYAKGDGIADDTKALVAAYDYVLSKMDEYDWNASGVLSPSPEYIIYLPNGTYRVTDSIIYSGPWRTLNGYDDPVRGIRKFERLVRIRFFGESREGTVIRLDDSCDGFSSNEKSVLSFGKSDLNNAVAYNSVRNLTIHTGSDNPSAIGLNFCGANNSGLHNVAVLSGDGQGVAGIDFRICPAMGYHDDLLIEGFDHGLRMTPYHMTHNCFEYVTLKNQRKAGVHVGECSASIRKLKFSGQVPAVEVATESGQAIVLDSEFSGTNRNVAAIIAPEGHLYARNVITSGYATALEIAGTPINTERNITEFATGHLRVGQADQPFDDRRSGSPDLRASLNLPIEDAPQSPWPTNFDQWANVDQFGAVGDDVTDDSTAIQAAMNSGKPVVYFPKPQYRFKKPVAIPASVKRIIGFYGSLNGELSVSEESADPLLIEDVGTNSRTIVRHSAPRTLVLSHMRLSYFNENRSEDIATGVKVFINNCNGLGKNDRVFRDGRFWVRFINTEYKKSPNFTCNHSDMWTFGYKVEGHMTNFESIGGGRLEVLGGICNEHGQQADADTPVLRCTDSQLSYIGLTNGPNRFNVIAEHTRNGITKKLLSNDCPPRPGKGIYSSWRDVFVPSLLCSTDIDESDTTNDSVPILEEDFSSGQASLKKWKAKDLSMWTVSEEKRLVGNNTSDSPGIGINSPVFEESDLRATFRFKILDSKGVQFKLNYAGGGHLGRFIIQPGGFFFQANKNRPLAITEARNFELLSVPVSKETWHSFAIELKGETITGTLDGKASKTYQYRHLRHEIGQVAFSVMGKSAEFDDLVIAPITPLEQTVSKGKTETNERRITSQKTSQEKNTDSKTSNWKEPAPKGRSDSEWVNDLGPFFASHCNDCHGDGAEEGNFELSSLGTDFSDAETQRKWTLVFDRVQKNEMPPKDYDRPDSQSQSAFLNTLSEGLTAAHATHREVVLRRLNRAEYENTVNDLLGIDIRLADLLPADASKHGFDNNGGALSLSPELVEVYLNAANLALDRAIGDKQEPERIKISKSVRELVHDNMYSRWFKLLEKDGGTVIYSSQFGAGSQLNLYRTKTNGVYRFRIHAKAWQSDEPVMMQIQSGILTRSGNKRFVGFFSVPPEGRVVEFTDYMSGGESIYPRPFGTIKNIAGFLQQGKRKIEEYTGAGLHISKVEIEGPIEPWPPVSRSRLIGDVDLDNGTVNDARLILSDFLPRAFRRVAQPSEIDAYTQKVAELMSSGRSFEESLRWALRAALCSADFLFLEEPVIDGEIDDFALANRLSYFLWSSPPDEELTRLALQKKLRHPDVLHQQTDRLLQRDRSRELTQNFAHQWLDLRDIDATSPDTKLYPDFDEHLKTSMVKESERFFEEVLQQNESIRCFIDSDWIIVNQRLAKHYGIDNVAGDQFRRIRLPENSVRGGVMTQASVLKVTANGANTSPVTRGVWMLENIMGIHPPPPPPNVPAVVPDVTGANTLRQLLEKHRGEESCNSCHKLIDPPGFALEEFDAIGSWRRKYQFQGSRKLLPVDSSGITRNGDRFNGVRDYKQIAMKEIDQVTYGLANKLMTYATGREMGFSDRAELHSIVERIKQKDYGFRDLVHEVVQSKIFRSP